MPLVCDIILYNIGGADDATTWRTHIAIHFYSHGRVNDI